MIHHESNVHGFIQTRLFKPVGKCGGRGVCLSNSAGRQFAPNSATPSSSACSLERMQSKHSRCFKGRLYFLCHLLNCDFEMLSSLKDFFFTFFFNNINSKSLFYICLFFKTFQASAAWHVLTDRHWWLMKTEKMKLTRNTNYAVSCEIPSSK